MLIAIDDARARVLAAVRPLGREEVALDAAGGRTLAENVTSSIDVPSFDSSAMDGLALHPGPAARVEVIGEARAGSPWTGELGEGHAIRISTGARVPADAGAVIPVERTRANGNGVDVEETKPGDNIRRRGEDIRSGDVVLRSGSVLGAAELGVAAAVGRPALVCALRPRVVVLVTGDELSEPGEPLGPGGIYSSNGYALAEQVRRAGAELTERVTVRDSKAATREAIGLALERNDVVVISGGVSVGPHDHVKGALRELGAEEHFWGVNLRPGKPTWFGTRGNTLAFGLPGNPVSAMVTFQLFARPALAALQGADPAVRRTRAILEAPVARNREREQAIRVRLAEDDRGLLATPTGKQGSHILTSMVGAGGLARIGAGQGEVPRGESVEVELL